MEANAPLGRRETRRKSLIRTVLERDYSGQPVLLDELRWAVRLADIDDARVDVDSTRSWQNSFARTVREHFPELSIHNVGIGAKTPLGVIARMAVYRQHSRQAIVGFLRGKDPCVLCRFNTNIDVEEPRYSLRYVNPQFHAASFRFFPDGQRPMTYAEIEQVPGVFIPATHRISIVFQRGLPLNWENIGRIPWRLFGYEELDEWFEVSATTRLFAVKRNPRR